LLAPHRLLSIWSLPEVVLEAVKALQQVLVAAVVLAGFCKLQTLLSPQELL
jgi:hypothetical protein